MSEFVECDSCRAKPGSPTLCAECLRRRDAWCNETRDELMRFRASMKTQVKYMIEKLADQEWEYEVLGSLEYCTGYCECGKRYGHHYRIVAIG